MSLEPRLLEVIIEVLKHNLDSLFEWLIAVIILVDINSKTKLNVCGFIVKQKQNVKSHKYMSREVVKL